MRKQTLCQIFICIMIIPGLVCGCSHFTEGFQARANFEEAGDFFRQGNYKASLDTYGQIFEKYPTTGDRVLFEMGILYAHPKNEQKDYRKSLESFQKLINFYPGSWYRQDSQMMIFYINNVVIKDEIIAGQQTRIATLQQDLKGRGDEIIALQQEVKDRGKEVVTLQKNIEPLEQDVFALRKGPVDKILIEKKARQLMLLSKGEVLKSYPIALGGNPDGPKERQGDSRTPEGTYFIDSRNRDSQYHLSLHISYPNERDKERARELGVSPGGNIMIHGIKNGFSRVGDSHAEVDWTNGCIAVTDEEIEEIEKLVPNGTVVEIRP